MRTAAEKPKQKLEEEWCGALPDYAIQNVAGQECRGLQPAFGWARMQQFDQTERGLKPATTYD
jgi:hypothetical protein